MGSSNGIEEEMNPCGTAGTGYPVSSIDRKASFFARAFKGTFLMNTSITRCGILVLMVASGSVVGGKPIRNSLGQSGGPGFVPERNMVNLRERNLPADWCVEEGKLKNVKWSADVGNESFGQPVVAQGMVFVATNDPRRDPKTNTNPAVLMAFSERDGKLLWRNVHPCSNDPLCCGCPAALLSTPTVDDDKLYYATPTSEVICAACKNGNILWRHDLSKRLKTVSMYRCACSPLIVGDLVFITTGHGRTDYDTIPLDKDAPSFVALNKHTGKLVWESALPSANVIRGQWSNPTFAMVDGVPLVLFGGGDGVLYGLAPESGKMLWKCDCLPKSEREGQGNTIVSTPVVVGHRIYLGLGVHCGGGEHRKKPHSYFLCLDLRGKGDVSFKSYDAKAPENKGSALVWAFGGPITPRPAKGRGVYFDATMSTAAVHDGLVYISEQDGYLHCLDANTGHCYWVHDVGSKVNGSAYWVDGRVYLGTDEGRVWILEHGKTRKLLAKIDMEYGPILTTPTAGNGVLFVLERSKLYALARPAAPVPKKVKPRCD